MENVVEKKESYLGCSYQRIISVVSEIYCYLPQSGSVPCGKHNQKLGIGSFKFPEDIVLFKFWKVAFDQCSSDTFIVLIHGADIFEILKTTKPRVFVNFMSR